MMRFVLADLRRLWLGSLVLVLIVGLAVALGVAVTLQERALRLGSARAADKFDLVIGAAGSENQLVLSAVFLQASPLPLMDGGVLTALVDDTRVAWAAPIGFGDSFSGYPIVGTSRALVENLSEGLAEGAPFAREGEAVVGASVDLPLGTTVKPMHGGAEEGGHTHTELAYTVVGRLQPTGTAWDRAILVPIQAVWHLHGLGHDQGEGTENALPSGGSPAPGEDGHAEDVHEDEEEGHAAHANAALEEDWEHDVPGLPAILVKPKSISDAYQLRQQYRQEPTLAVFPGEVLTRLYATLGDAKQVLVAVAAGSQVLVAASLLLVTVMHVGQRRRQIGALRAFGAPRGALFAIVWTELFALFVAGVALGFALGFGAARALADRLTSESGITLPVFFQRGDLVSIAILLGAAVLLSLIPAVMAYRQSPATALR